MCVCVCVCVVVLCVASLWLVDVQYGITCVHQFNETSRYVYVKILTTTVRYSSGHVSFIVLCVKWIRQMDNASVNVSLMDKEESRPKVILMTCTWIPCNWVCTKIDRKPNGRRWLWSFSYQLFNIYELIISVIISVTDVCSRVLSWTVWLWRIMFGLNAWLCQCGST